MKALAYLRTSSAANVGGDSDARQRAAIAAYADRTGIAVEREFYDAAVWAPIRLTLGRVSLRYWNTRLKPALSASSVRTRRDSPAI